MWQKIKNALLAILGALVGFFAILAGLRKRKIEKQEEKIDNLETENKVKDVEIKAQGVATENEVRQAEKLVEQKVEETSKVEAVRDGKTSYNDIIKGWNAEK